MVCSSDPLDLLLHNSLVDQFGRRHDYLRLSVTDRCNLRCAYCMPPEGIPLKSHDDILRYEEITRLVTLLAWAGVRKVRITGGEPLVRSGVVDLVAQIARVPGIETVGMTTNGLLLAHHAAQLKAAGLDRLNVSLDTLHPDRFERLTRSNRHADVLTGIDAALAAGFAPLKINVVVIGGVNDDEVPQFVALASKRPVCVRFIEYMPFHDNQWREAQFVSYRDVRKIVERECHLIPVGDSGNSKSVAQEFQIQGGAGQIGFIAPVSDHGCRQCNRLRLMADGSLKSCLFRPAEINLRDELRSNASDKEVLQKVREVLAEKHPEHPSVEELLSGENQSMIEIGG